MADFRINASTMAACPHLLSLCPSPQRNLILGFFRAFFQTERYQPEWNLVPHSTAQYKKCCAVLYLKAEFQVLLKAV